jgi:hypothetical protein
MTDHGIANLRTNYPRVHGSEATQRGYEQQIERFRATMTSRFAVCPGQTLTTPSGRVVKATEPVDVSMLHGGETAAWMLLEQHVRTGTVVESNGAGAADANARHYVASGGSISCSRGILGPGQAVSAADFGGGEQALADLVARGAIVDRGVKSK